MAVFEQKVSSRVTLDDTIPLTCIIENAFVVKDHTVSASSGCSYCAIKLTYINSSKRSRPTADTDSRASAVAVPVAGSGSAVSGCPSISAARPYRPHPVHIGRLSIEVFVFAPAAPAIHKLRFHR